MTTNTQTEFARARLVPFDRSGDNALEDEAVELDFNPETLQMEVSNTLSSDRQKDRQRQYVSETVSTLSFDAVFDTTRPKSAADAEPSSPEKLDVRKRTEVLIKLLDARQQDKPAPRKVRFEWGSVSFVGVFDSYSETLEYFSPEGVPLRSRVSVMLTEQAYQSGRRDLDAGDYLPGDPQPSAPESGAAEETASGDQTGLLEAARRAADRAAQEIEQLAGRRVSTPGFAAGGGLGATSLSGTIEGRVRAQLGVSMSADLAIDTFGETALHGQLDAGVDLGRIASGDRTADAPKAGAATRWAPSAPPPGSRGHAVAEALTLRASPQRADRDAPLITRGTPPRAKLRVRANSAPPLLVQQRDAFENRRTTARGPRPDWEHSPELDTSERRRDQHCACCQSKSRDCSCKPKNERH